jgi:hypothetical protein
MNKQKLGDLIDLASGQWVGFDAWLGLRGDDTAVRVDNGHGVGVRPWEEPRPTLLHPEAPSTGTVVGSAPWGG